MLDRGLLVHQARLRERLTLSEQLGAIVQAVQEDFLRLRVSKKRTKDVVPALKEWMRAEAE